MYESILKIKDYKFKDFFKILYTNTSSNSSFWSEYVFVCVCVETVNTTIHLLCNNIYSTLKTSKPISLNCTLVNTLVFVVTPCINCTDSIWDMPQKLMSSVLKQDIEHNRSITWNNASPFERWTPRGLEDSNSCNLWFIGLASAIAKAFSLDSIEWSNSIKPLVLIPQFCRLSFVRFACFNWIQLHRSVMMLVGGNFCVWIECEM